MYLKLSKIQLLILSLNGKANMYTKILYSASCGETPFQKQNCVCVCVHIHAHVQYSEIL